MPKISREQAKDMLEQTRTWGEFSDVGDILDTVPALLKFDGHSAVEIDWHAVEAFAQEVAIRALIEVCDDLKGWPSSIEDRPEWLSVWHLKIEKSEGCEAK